MRWCTPCAVVHSIVRAVGRADHTLARMSQSSLLPCHCEECNDEAIQLIKLPNFTGLPQLLKQLRNDGEKLKLVRKQRSYTKRSLDAHDTPAAVRRSQ